MNVDTRQLNQDMLDAIFSLGTNFFIQGKYKKAAVIFDGLLALNPHNASASLALGEVLLMEGHLEKALSHFVKEMQKGNLLPETLLGAARAYQLLGQFEEAKNTVLPIIEGEIVATKSMMLIAKLIYER